MVDFHEFHLYEYNPFHLYISMHFVVYDDSEKTGESRQAKIADISNKIKEYFMSDSKIIFFLEFICSLSF